MRNGVFIQFQSTPKTLPNYKGRQVTLQRSLADKHQSSDQSKHHQLKVKLCVNRQVATREFSVTPAIFLPKLHNPNLIMRKQEVNPKLKEHSTK